MSANMGPLYYGGNIFYDPPPAPQDNRYNVPLSDPQVPQAPPANTPIPVDTFRSTPSTMVTSVAVATPSSPPPLVSSRPIHNPSVADEGSPKLSRGLYLTAILVPMAIVALFVSACVFCVLRRKRRRERREGARELKNLSQDSVQDLSTRNALAPHSRPVSEVAPGMKSEYYSAFSDSPPPRHGPLITVDGPSFSRAREELPPPSYNNSTSTDSNSGSPTSPARPASSQFPDPAHSMYRNGLRSPFADAEDDLVSEMSASDARRAAARDPDAISVISDVPDYIMRVETTPRRGV